MKLGIVLETKEPEKAWNALRFATTARNRDHEVRVFLLGEAVEIEEITHEEFDVAEQLKELDDAGGEVEACGTCLELRKMDGSETCPMSTMHDCLDIVEWADKALTF